MIDFIGHTIEHYQILELIGQGGMAVVYKALDVRLNREVAVKIINKEAIPPADLPDMFRRFDNEARLMAGLDHPNIIKVIDYGEYEGYPYLVMPYLPGGTLKARMGKPTPWREAVQIILPMTQALGYAHKQRGEPVHRDVKPSNILMTANGEPILTDFGIARIRTDENHYTLTKTGTGIGTPEYMSPEQGLGKKVDGRADIYSLGIVLYELLTGRQPYTADTPLAVVLKQINDPLPPPHLFVSGLPGPVERVIIRALEKSPQNRYQSMDEFAKALELLLTDGSNDEQDNGPRRTFIKVLFLITGGIFLVALFAWWIIKSFEDDPGGETGNTPTPTSVQIIQVPSLAPTTNSPTPPPQVIAQSTATPEPICTDCVFIPSGQFIMGATNNDLLIVSSQTAKDELPSRTVYLDAYWIDRLEVSNQKFSEFVRITNYVTEAEEEHSAITYDIGQKGFPLYSSPNANWKNPDGSGNGIAGYENYPVVQISWRDAVAYCQWRGGRLPTEAEWEKAGRGTTGKVYPWGNNYQGSIVNGSDVTLGQDSITLIYDDGYAFVAPVDSFPGGASDYGLLNMSGNVTEWVQDYYDASYYSKNVNENPTGPSTGFAHILKGGSWYSGPGNNRLSNRTSAKDGDLIMQNYGLRCAYDD